VNNLKKEHVKLTMKNVDVSHHPCLRLNAPALFKDKEFIEWLNSDESNVATWHQGGEPDDFSDVFTWYDSNGEGSDSDMPEHCWKSLVKVFEDNNFQGGIAWLTNLE